MSESIKVVVHTSDGTLTKGSTHDFHPDRPAFSLVLSNGVETVPFTMPQLKAVFFVKQLQNANPRPRRKTFSPSDGNRGNGRPIAVQFHDGELLVGYTHSYNAKRQGFFMLPSDPKDNNLRIFVVRSAVKALKVGSDAEEFARSASAAAKPDPPVPVSGASNSEN